MVRIGKYEFLSKEQAQTKIVALGVDEYGNQSFNHAIVELGHILLEEAVYEAGEGEELVLVTPAVFSDKYSVDALWVGLEETNEEGELEYNHPYGWATYSINPSEEGVHSFWGVSFQEYKI
jgi:hypothetical protein